MTHTELRSVCLLLSIFLGIGVHISTNPAYDVLFGSIIGFMILIIADTIIMESR